MPVPKKTKKNNIKKPIQLNIELLQAPSATSRGLDGLVPRGRGLILLRRGCAPSLPSKGWGEKEVKGEYLGSRAALGTRRVNRHHSPF